MNGLFKTIALQALFGAIGDLRKGGPGSGPHGTATTPQEAKAGAPLTNRDASRAAAKASVSARQASAEVHDKQTEESNNKAIASHEAAAKAHREAAADEKKSGNSKMAAQLHANEAKFHTEKAKEHKDSKGAFDKSESTEDINKGGPGSGPQGGGSKELTAGSGVSVKGMPGNFVFMGGGTGTHTYVRNAGGGKNILVPKKDLKAL